jgi:hypothetical protein
MHSRRTSRNMKLDAPRKSEMQDLNTEKIEELNNNFKYLNKIKKKNFYHQKKYRGRQKNKKK